MAVYKMGSDAGAAPTEEFLGWVDAAFGQQLRSRFEEELEKNPLTADVFEREAQLLLSRLAKEEYENDDSIYKSEEHPFAS